jgi:hypothetical protein
VFKNQDTSVAKAKKAIADYKKAVGQTGWAGGLEVFYCERAAGFSSDVGLQDEGYFDALVRMFAQALKTIDALCRRIGTAQWLGTAWMRAPASATTSATASVTTWTTCWPSMGSMIDRDRPLRPCRQRTPD